MPVRRVLSLGADAPSYADGYTDMSGRHANYIEYVGKGDLQSLFTHELGHALGVIEHADIGIMSAAASPNAADRHVQPTDCELLP